MGLFFFEYENVNDCSINYKSLSGNKNYLKKIEDKFKKPMQKKKRKDAYPPGFMDDWKKSRETSLLHCQITAQKKFYSNLNMENISDSDYYHSKKL